MRNRSDSNPGIAISGAQQLAQDVLQDAAVAVVNLLLGRIDPDHHLETLAVSFDGQLIRDIGAAGDPGDAELLVARKAK